MAALVSAPPPLSTLPFSSRKANLEISSTNISSSIAHTRLILSFTLNPHRAFQTRHHLGWPLSRKLIPSTPTKGASNDFLTTDVGYDDEQKILPSLEEPPLKFLFWVVLWASLSLALFAASGDAEAAIDSVKASSFGLRVATALRSSGWPDEAVVFALATLPVIELRGAIPVGYWMQLKPIMLTVLSVLGNMVPVPFILFYLKRFSSYLAGKNLSASPFVDVLFKNAKEKAGPVEEFQWLGLMLFVAVPFPGTGAWTGAFIASIIDMPFWPAVSANFCGVVIAGLLVNLLVNLGLKYAIATGIILFFTSTVMWNFLRNLRKFLKS